jgi:hypothetical protein
VKLEPLGVLVRLLKAVLSVNVSVAFAVPANGAAYVILTRQAPPEGSVVGKELAPFEQSIGPNVNCGPETAITALLSVSPVWPSPIFDTVMICVPVCPAATLPKPRLLVEKNTTGAVTLISGVTVTWSITVIISLTVGIVMVAGGGGGGAVLLPSPFRAIDWVKFDPNVVLVRLLKAALSVNVSVPVSVDGEEPV